MINRLTVRDLNRSFSGNNMALCEVKLQLANGITVVLGPNGSGKSTLLRCLASVIAPTSGSIRWNGENIWQNISCYRWLVGYLPQDFSGHNQMSVQGFLGYMAALKLIPHHLVPARVSDLLALFSLQAYRNATLDQLSGGILHRVGLAQALLNDPEILILDEPTVGLDPEERLTLLDLVRQQAEERIVVFSTHLAADADAVADNLVILNGGRVQADLPAARLLELCRGLVWQVLLPSLSALPAGALVSRSVAHGNAVQARVLLPKQPGPTATPGCPSMEDAYLAVIHGLLRHAE